MSSTIETLPQPVLIAICHYLEQDDVIYLASSSKTLWKVANDQEVWKRCASKSYENFVLNSVIYSQHETRHLTPSSKIHAYP